VAKYKINTGDRWEKGEINAPLTVYPFKQTVYIKSGETKQVVLNASQGVNVEGIISRPIAGF